MPGWKHLASHRKPAKIGLGFRFAVTCSKGSGFIAGAFALSRQLNGLCRLSSPRHAIVAPQVIRGKRRASVSHYGKARLEACAHLSVRARAGRQRHRRVGRAAPRAGTQAQAHLPRLWSPRQSPRSPGRALRVLALWLPPYQAPARPRLGPSTVAIPGSTTPSIRFHR